MSMTNYEALKSGATQIMSEVEEGKNTSTRVGSQLLEMVESNNTDIVSIQKSLSDHTTELASLSRKVSEKADESEVTDLARKVSDLDAQVNGKDVEMMNGNIGEKTWSNVGDSGYNFAIIPVNADDTLYIKANDNQKCNYAILKEYPTLVSGGAIPFAGSVTTRPDVAKGTDATIIAPSDALYIVVLYNYASTDNRYKPSVLTINGVDALSYKDGIIDDIASIQSEVSIAESNITILKYPKMIVKYSEGKFEVYQQDGNNKSIYYMLSLEHDTLDYSIVYRDLWRIKTGGVYSYDGTSFTSLGLSLLNGGGENEFAFKFSGKADFTGGFHGDEQITTDGSFLKFYMDGVPVIFSSSTFTKECNSFYMLQSSTLHDTTEDGSTIIEGHPVIARHFKKTEFVNQGYKVTNYVKFDFSAITDTERQIDTWFAGLCCVHKDGAKYFYAEDYNIHTAQNDGRSWSYGVILGSKVCYNSDNLGCEVSSKVITENDDNCTLQIWDRTSTDNDEKYYRYAPTRKVSTNDIFKNEMNVSWQYYAES